VASVRRFIFRLLNACRTGRAEPDLDRELKSHVGLLEDDFQRRGLSPAEARLAAKRAFGSVELTKELHRDARSFMWMDDAWRDVRYTVRTLRKTPGFSAVAIFTLALGIGATTAIFTIVRPALLQPLPVTNPQELVLLGNARGSGTGTGLAGSFDLYSYDLYRHLQDTGVFDGLCAVQSTKARIGVRMAGTSEAEPAWTRLVSGNPTAFVAMRLRRGLLYEVSPADPTYAIGGSVILMMCMILAGYSPARYASRIEPMAALRADR
jgi:hypothetical protein